MKKMIIFGYGPGISYATARRFGQEGYAPARVGRNDRRLTEGVARLEAEGLTARAYRSDASDPAMSEGRRLRSAKISASSLPCCGPPSAAAI